MNTWCQKVFFCYILIHPHDHNELKKKIKKNLSVLKNDWQFFFAKFQFSSADFNNFIFRHDFLFWKTSSYFSYCLCKIKHAYYSSVSTTQFSWPKLGKQKTKLRILILDKVFVPYLNITVLRLALNNLTFRKLFLS